MSRNIFVSYRFSDRNIAHNVKTFFQPQEGSCDGMPKYVELNLSSLGPQVIDDEILRVMSQCMGVLLVVGDDSHNSTWIDREVQLADSLSLGMVAVRLPKTTGGLPNRVRGRNIPFVDWSERTLCDALNRLEDKRNNTPGSPTR
jgi:hypothetical protein